jgi:integrase
VARLRQTLSGRAGKPLTHSSYTITRDTTRGDLTAHGFRSTFRDWAAETGKPADIAEAALAHVVGGKVQQAYQRGDLLARRHVLMDQWAAFCGLSHADKVVALRT